MAASSAVDPRLLNQQIEDAFGPSAAGFPGQPVGGVLPLMVAKEDTFSVVRLR